MENHEEKPSLPRVNQDDLDVVELEGLSDGKHIMHWLYLYDQNPILFKKAQEEIYNEIDQSHAAHEDASQLYVRMLGVVASKIRSLQIALERELNEKREVISVDGDGEDPQP